MMMDKIMRQMHAGWIVVIVSSLFCPACNMASAAKTIADVEKIADHRVVIKIDQTVTIVPLSEKFHGNVQMNMVRHPDGTIYLNGKDRGLIKSVDNGQTWISLPLNMRKRQWVHGIGASRDGQLWLLHQPGTPSRLFVSRSADGARTWKTTEIDFPNLSSKAPQRLYNTSDNDYNTFLERPDGTMMVTVGFRYKEGDDFLMADQSIPGYHETMIRSTDGGKTWGDPTRIHQYAAETSLAVDPNDPEHILAFTRTQRGLLPGEDAAKVGKKTGVIQAYIDRKLLDKVIYKNGLLLESNDGGRSFHEVKGAMLGFGAYRGDLLWTPNNVIVATHQRGSHFQGTHPRPGSRGDELMMRLSLDGGKTWVTGTKEGTPFYNRSKAHEFVVKGPGRHTSSSPTVEISPKHFLTVYGENYKGQAIAIRGLFWHIEPKYLSGQETSSDR